MSAILGNAARNSAQNFWRGTSTSRSSSTGAAAFVDTTSKSTSSNCNSESKSQGHLECSKQRFVNYMEREEKETHRMNLAYSLAHTMTRNDFENPTFLEMSQLSKRQLKQLKNSKHLNSEMKSQQQHHSDFYKKQFLHWVEQNDHKKNDMSYSLSYGMTKSDFNNSEFMTLLSDRQKRQLENVNTDTNTILHDENDIVPHISASIETDFNNPAFMSLVDHLEKRQTHMPSFHNDPLPLNLAEASILNDPRAIVVTEACAPFQIAHVNNSWEQLCGYTLDEIKGQTLACIQGPETEKKDMTDFLGRLLEVGEEKGVDHAANINANMGTVLTNYTKHGRKFYNRLRMGPLTDHGGNVTHFVGVLCEVQDHKEGAAAAIGHNYNDDDGRGNMMRM